MRATSYDAIDAKNGRLTKISEEEARRIIETGKNVIVQVRRREFLEAITIQEFEQMKKLNNEGIYDMFVCYKEKTP